MANVKETATWENGIYQLETTDPVLGGENGIDNLQARQLANRTQWLKTEIASAVADIGNLFLSCLCGRNLADIGNLGSGKFLSCLCGRNRLQIDTGSRR